MGYFKALTSLVFRLCQNNENGFSLCFLLQGSNLINWDQQIRICSKEESKNFTKLSCASIMAAPCWNCTLWHCKDHSNGPGLPVWQFPLGDLKHDVLIHGSLQLSWPSFFLAFVSPSLPCTTEAFWPHHAVLHDLFAIISPMCYRKIADNLDQG